MPSFTSHVLLESDAVFKVRVTNSVDSSSVLDEHALVYPAAEVFSGAITSCKVERLWVFSASWQGCTPLFLLPKDLVGTF